jgi:hypothetical protein
MQASAASEDVVCEAAMRQFMLLVSSPLFPDKRKVRRPGPLATRNGSQFGWRIW